MTPLWTGYVALREGRPSLMTMSATREDAVDKAWRADEREGRRKNDRYVAHEGVVRVVLQEVPEP